MPSVRHARMIRRAISPRLAIKTRRNMLDLRAATRSSLLRAAQAGAGPDRTGPGAYCPPTTPRVRPLRRGPARYATDPLPVRGRCRACGRSAPARGHELVAVADDARLAILLDAPELQPHRIADGELPQVAVDDLGG